MLATRRPLGPRRPNNAEKQFATDLGLAVSALSLRPGQARTLNELAAFCGCSKQLISQLEHRAITKVRLALKRRHGIISTNR